MKSDNKRLRILVIFLSVLLALVLSALAIVLARRVQWDTGPPSAVVTDNVITPEEQQVSEGRQQETTSPTVSSGAEVTVVDLNSTSYTGGTPFWMPNLFPGDSESKTIQVNVSHKEKVTVYFSAGTTYQEGALADWLNLQVNANGETIYDGALSGLGDGIPCTLAANTANTTDTIEYQITASLSTEAGNELQDQTVMAQLNWWVDDTTALTKPPKTADLTQIWPFIVFGGAVLALVVLWIVSRKRREADSHA